MQGTCSVIPLSLTIFLFSLWQNWYTLAGAATSNSPLLLRADRKAAQHAAVGMCLMGFAGAKACHAVVLMTTVGGRTF